MSHGIRGGLLRRHRDFRLLWCGETVSKFGASVTGVAMPLVAVSTLHASTFEVGLVSAAAWTPWLIIGLPVGAWVDRLRRRPIMLASAAVSLLLFMRRPGRRMVWLVEYRTTAGRRTADRHGSSVLPDRLRRLPPQHSGTR